MTVPAVTMIDMSGHRGPGPARDRPAAHPGRPARSIRKTRRPIGGHDTTDAQRRRKVRQGIAVTRPGPKP